MEGVITASAISPGGTIVCGVGGGDSELVVHETALWLQRAYGVPLIVVHARQGEAAAEERILTEIRVRMSECKECETKLVEGAPAKRLLEVARAERAEFLVVGSRRHGALRSGVGRSVSRRLARKASCPVLVVPRETGPGGAPGNRTPPAIVCGVDGSEHSLRAVRVARDLAQRLDYGVAVAHAPRSARSLSYLGRSSTPSLSQQPDQVRRRSVEIVQEAVDLLGEHAVAVHVEAGHPADVLVALAREMDGRLIVVAGRDSGALSASLFGSVANRVVSASEVPVVIVPENAHPRAS